MKAISVRNLYYSYGKNAEVLKDINLDIEKGETVIILGSSGVGKSTLLRCINRLIEPEPKSGKIFINGNNILKTEKKELHKIRRKIGMIFQGFNIINTIPVINAVLAGRLAYNNTLKSFFNVFSSEDYKIAMHNLERVGIEKYANRWVGHLSGGEKQRVGIARALSQQPEIILADEPVSNLDFRLMGEIMDLIKNVCDEDNLTLVANLHLIELAKKHADRIIGMHNGMIVFNDIPSRLTKQKIEEIYGRT